MPWFVAAGDARPEMGPMADVIHVQVAKI